MKTFEENIILNIYRTYGKDESVALLKQEMTKLNVEIGILKSEYEELTYEYDTLKENCRTYNEEESIKLLKEELQNSKNKNKYYKDICKKNGIYIK